MTRKPLAFLLALLLLLLTTLSGCTGQGAGDSSAPSSPSAVSTPTEESGSTAPPVEGTFPEGPVTTVDLNTAGWTSTNEIIETEAGYYSICSNQLRYADKSDLSNWVVVCNKPDCSHEWGKGCPAENCVVFLEGDRIFFTDEMTADGTGVMLYSMARDGSDLRMEFPIAGAEQMSGSAISRRAAGNMLCLGFSEMQNDGSGKNRLIRVTSSGSEIVLETEVEELTVPVLGGSCYHATDAVMIDSRVYPGSEGKEYRNCRMTATGLEELSNADQYGDDDGFLFGDYLYRYVPNDGYYVTQLSTGASKRQMDAQLKDAVAFRLTDQWAVETNIRKNAPPPETPEIRIFNGSEWKSVQVPENVGKMTCRPIALTTEHIFFRAVEETPETLGFYYYYVTLADENYTMQRVRFKERA